MYFFNSLAKNKLDGDKYIMKKVYKTYFIFIIFTALIISAFHSLFTIKNDSQAINNINIYQEKVAYLTFDDGPSKNTEKLLEILDKYNIKATFFVVGPSYSLKDNYIKKIVQHGHQIAIHSYEHNYNHIYSSLENYLEDFNKCATWIEKLTGTKPNIYRFPGGSSNTIANKELVKQIIKHLESQGYTHADWNVDTLDSYVKDDKTKIINNALTSIKRNENNKHYYQTILMHDDIKKSATIDALPLLIEKILSYGYHFERLTQDSHIIKHIK